MTHIRNSITIVVLILGVTVIPSPGSAREPSAVTKVVPGFQPESFFLGRTEGAGSLKVIFRRSQLVHVHGQGRIAPDGSLILDQDIEEFGKSLKHRRWVMRSNGGGRYSATLSDATGPVIGRVTGNVMRLAFPAKGGLRIKQVITLATDGQSAENRLDIVKFGVIVGTLREVIRRVG